MRKIILILGVVFFSGLNVFSQQHLTLSNATTDFPNGSTMNVTGDTNTTIYSYIYIANGSSSTMSVKCKKKHISVIPGTENYICWGGQCWLDTTLYLVPTPTVINAGDTSKSDFTGEYYPFNHAGVSTIRYTFFDMNQVNDSVCIFIAYKAKGVGINEISPVTAGEIYPNPADNATYLNYSILSKYDNAELRVMDLLGNKVQVIPLNNSEGKIRINTENFTSGIYFYSMILDGRSVFTRKLIVRHS